MADVEKVVEELKFIYDCLIEDEMSGNALVIDNAIQTIRELQEQNKWHYCKDELPTDLEIVNVVWCNHNPPSYYQNIKDKRFIASAICFNGKWYWYSSTCIDYLKEYGKNDFDLIDEDVEVIAWMELPKFEESEE